MKTWIELYLAGINVLAFLLYGIDKRRAVRHAWRIPERTLLCAAGLGGSLGALLGMRVFHHKTQKRKFRIGVPAIFLVQAAIGSLFLMKHFIIV